MSLRDLVRRAQRALASQAIAGRAAFVRFVMPDNGRGPAAPPETRRGRVQIHLAGDRCSFPGCEEQHFGDRVSPEVDDDVGDARPAGGGEEA
jgi:hypothetical protein